MAGGMRLDADMAHMIADRAGCVCARAQQAGSLVRWRVRIGRLHVAAGLYHRRRRAVSQFGKSEEHTSELQSLMRISYAVFCLKKKKTNTRHQPTSDLVTTHTQKHSV